MSERVLRLCSILSCLWHEVTCVIMPGMTWVSPMSGCGLSGGLAGKSRTKLGTWTLETRSLTTECPLHEISPAPCVQTVRWHLTTPGSLLIGIRPNNILMRPRGLGSVSLTPPLRWLFLIKRMGVWCWCWSWLWEWYCAPHSPGEPRPVWPGGAGLTTLRSLPRTAHGSSWLSAWSWHSLVPGPTVRPCTHFPIVPPSTSPHTNCFTVRKPPLVARFGHHNIYLGAQNTSKTQKMLGLECGAQLGLGSPSPLSWGWDHDRSDHWPILSPCHEVGCRAILRDIWSQRHMQCSHMVSWQLCHRMPPLPPLYLLRTLFWYLKRLHSPLSLWWPLLKMFGFRTSN